MINRVLSLNQQNNFKNKPFNFIISQPLPAQKNPLRAQFLFRHPFRKSSSFNGSCGGFWKVEKYCGSYV